MLTESDRHKISILEKRMQRIRDDIWHFMLKTKHDCESDYEELFLAETDLGNACAHLSWVIKGEKINANN